MRPSTFLLVAALPLGACGSSPSTQTSPQLQPGAASPATSATASTMDFYGLKTTSLDGKPVDLAAFRGKVTLVVNVASACGYTPQYEGLQRLHAELKDRGFAVLGFPSNDFGGQEPGTAEEIRTFCRTKYGVDFPMFAKVQTKPGEGQSGIYALLGQQAGRLPDWNFCKYLVGKDGKVLAFHASRVAPGSTELRAAIEQALK